MPCPAASCRLCCVMRRTRTFFNSSPKLKKGLLLEDDIDQTPSLFAAIPEFTVHAGDRIETKANLPFKGYLRVFAGEEDQFMGLNTYLGIPGGLIESGTYQFEDAPTSAKVPRTIIYAFAAREPDIRRLADYS